MKSKQRALAFFMRNRLTIGTSLALVLLFTFARPASAFTYNMGMFWKRAFASFSWPFTTGTDANYSFGSSIEVTGNVAKLKSNDQVDSDNTTTGFGGGTLTGASWDSTNNYVRLTQSITNTALDNSWTPQYASIVGYWKLDGSGSIGSGAPANNITQTVGVAGSSSNANNSGMAYATGKVSQGITFDGSDDYVDMGNNLSITTDQITISCWFKPNALPTNEAAIVAKESNYKIDYNFNGNVRFLTSNNWAGSILSVSNPLTMGAWNHIVATYDGATKKLYFNGVASSTTVSTTGNLTSSTKALRLGKYDGSSESLNGTLDDCAIWNTALSAAEVSTIYTTQSPSPTNNSELDQSWTPEWSSLVAYWKMNNNWNDSKGTNNGTAANGATFTTSTKMGSHAGAFDGTNDYVEVPAHASLTPGTEVTFAAWIYPIAVDEEDCIIERWNQSSTEPQYVFSVYADLKVNNSWSTTGGGAWGTPSRNGVRSTGTVTLNTWNHIVSTRSGTNVSFYINGVPAGSSNPADTNPYTASTLTVRLGGQGRATKSRYFNGRIDEVAMWNKALTATQVAAIYSRQSAKYTGILTSRVMDAFATGMSWTTFSWVPTLPFLKELTDYASGSLQNESSTDYSSLVGSTGATSDNNLMSSLAALYHMNGSGSLANGASLTDESGNARTGTIYNGNGTGLTYSTGKLGTALYFDGVDDEIDIASGLNPWGGDFSFSLWAYPTSKSAVQHNALAVGSNATNGFRFGIASSDRWRYWTTESGGTVVIGDATVSPPALYTWQHLSITYKSSTSTTKMYVNGVEVASSTGTYVAPGAGGSIGKYGGYKFEGYLDEIAIWGRTLHATEVQQLYRRGANRIKHQVRICTASDCSDDSTGANWKGPDGTNQTYFSELNNNSVPLAMTGDVQKGLPSMLFSNFTSPVGTSRYFQYRTFLESDDTGTGCDYGSGATWCSPELKSVTVDPTHYDSTSPTIIGQTGVSYFALSNFTETLGASCPSGIGYNLGIGTAYSNATWYWWDSSANAGAGAWATADGTVAKSNSAATIALKAASFRAQISTSNTVYFKAFLKSSGTTACELDQINISGQQ